MAQKLSKIYQQHSAEVTLLLTDMRMPEMNGVEWADRILRWKRTPAKVLVAAHAA